MEKDYPNQDAWPHVVLKLGHILRHGSYNLFQNETIFYLNLFTGMVAVSLKRTLSQEAPQLQKIYNYNGHLDSCHWWKNFSRNENYSLLE